MTSSEEELGRIARQRIRTGELPHDPSALQLWGSHGAGQPCSLCGRAIHPQEVEYELAVSGEKGERILRFHLNCHSIWRSECARAAAGPVEVRR